MAEVTLYHNPRCSKSRQALEAFEAAGRDVDVVRYLDSPPSESDLRAVVAKLTDPVDRLVRRDKWDELGLTAVDVASPDAVVDVLVRHPQLMERPLIVTNDHAFIGRPTERVAEFLASREPGGTPGRRNAP